MKYLIQIVLFSLISASSGLGQIRIERTKPSVYIRFVEKTAGENSHSGENPELLWFRLYNNGRYGIRLDESGGMKPHDRDVTLYYDIVDREETVIERHRCHVCSINILKPGKNLLFAVVSYRLPQGHLLRIEFSYEWEDPLLIERDLGPRHFVFFHQP